MKKKDTTQDDHDKILTIEIEKRVHKEYGQRDKLICKSTTLGAAGFFYWMGTAIVHNIEAVRAGVFAFIEVFQRTK